jgi:hypothetical protein
MGQQAGTTGTWPRLNRLISQVFRKLWDSTRAKCTAEKTCPQKNSETAPGISSQIPEENREFTRVPSRYGMTVKIFQRS